MRIDKESPVSAAEKNVLSEIVQEKLSNEPYIIITADTHAGASIDAYRAYLDPKYHADFDAWRGSYKNPAEKHVGKKKTKN